jgi:hypothetical protein
LMSQSSTGGQHWSWLISFPAVRRSQLLPDISMLSPTRLSRQLHRLLDLGVVKRATGTYRYYLTKAGRAVTAAAEWLAEAVITPARILWNLADATNLCTDREKSDDKGLKISRSNGLWNALGRCLKLFSKCGRYIRHAGYLQTV